MVAIADPRRRDYFKSDFFNGICRMQTLQERDAGERYTYLPRSGSV